MNIIRNIITYTIYPGLLGFCILGGAWALQHGYSPQVVVVCFTAFAVVMFILSEKLNPNFSEWSISQHDEVTDAIHNIVSMIIIPKVMELLMHVTLLTVSIKIAEWAGSSLWPTTWPLLLQACLGIVIGDFGSYWIHRLAHEMPLLWRLHATHHSPTRLYWLNAGRFHPFDTLLEYTVSTSILIILGVTPEVLTLRALFTAVNGMFKHCNIKVKIGPLNWIFGASEVHRWHHSKKMEEANANYGTNIVLWDMIFGTYYFPKNKEMSADVGLFDMSSFPKNYIGQFLSPFKWKKNH